MGKLSDDEAAQLKALQDKADAPDEDPGQGGAGYGDGVIILGGSRADTFLASLFGGAESKGGKAPAKKTAAPAKKAAPGKAGPPAEDEEEEEGEEEQPTPRSNRYFR